MKKLVLKLNGKFTRTLICFLFVSFVVKKNSVAQIQPTFSKMEKLFSSTHNVAVFISSTTDDKGNYYGTFSFQYMNNHKWFFNDSIEISIPNPSDMGVYCSVVAKFDSTFKLQWYRLVEIPQIGKLSQIKTNNSNLVMIGHTDAEKNILGRLIPRNRKLIINFDLDGNLQWMKYFRVDSEINDVVIDDAGTIYIHGQSSSLKMEDETTNNAPSNLKDAFYVAKLNSDGTKDWVEFFGSRYAAGNNKKAGLLALDNDGNPIVTYHAVPLGNDRLVIGNFTYNKRATCIAKLNKNNGTPLWATFFDGIHSHINGGIVVNPTNGDIFYAMNTPPIMLKLDKDGTLIWDKGIGYTFITNLLLYNEKLYIFGRAQGNPFRLTLNNGDIVHVEHPLEHSVFNDALTEYNIQSDEYTGYRLIRTKRSTYSGHILLKNAKNQILIGGSAIGTYQYQQNKLIEFGETNTGYLGIINSLDFIKADKIENINIDQVADAGSNLNVTVSWKQLPYYVERYYTPRRPNEQFANWVTNVRTPHGDTNKLSSLIPKNEEYHYFVAASLYDQFVAWSDTLLIDSTISGGTFPPAAPSNLTATPTNSIELNWQDNSDNEDGFMIESATSESGPWYLIETTAANVTTYIHTGLNPGVEYFYRVKAFNADGESGYSNIASAVEGENAIQDVSSNSILIFPNPANNILFIHTNWEKIYSIDILGIDGKNIYSEDNILGNTNIDIKPLTPGLYFIKISQENQSQTKKLIITK